jgi:hypothetical protein
MKKSISILKNYFKTGDKPTQQQFYDFLESFVHLDSTILAAQVEGLETALQTLQALGINDIVGLQTALTDLNTAITTLEVADVSGLQSILDALAVVSIGDVTGLQDALNALAVVSIGDVTGLQDELNNKVTAATGFGLSENNFSTNYVNIISGLTTSVTALTYETIITQATASKTLALTDVNKRIMFTGATLNTVNIPLDAAVAWYSGTKIKGTVQGDGAVTIAGTGITFIGNTFTFAKGESFILTNTGLDLWTVEGNAAPAGAKTPYTVYIDTVNGNDATGTIEDASKPFKTDLAAYSALPASNNNVWDLVFLDNNVTRLLSQIPNRKIRIKTDNTGTFKFLNLGVITIALNCPFFELITPLSDLWIEDAVSSSMRSSWLKLIVKDITLKASQTGYSGFFGVNGGVTTSGNIICEQMLIQSPVAGVRLFSISGEIRIKKFVGNSASIYWKDSGSFPYMRIFMDEVQALTFPLTIEGAMGKNNNHQIKIYSGDQSITDNLSETLDVTGKVFTCLSFAYGGGGIVTGVMFNNTYSITVVVCNFVDFVGRQASRDTFGGDWYFKNCTIYTSAQFAYTQAHINLSASKITFDNLTVIQDTPTYFVQNQVANMTWNITKIGDFKTNATILKGTTGTGTVIITDVAQNELTDRKFSNYPNTRDDGANPTNKTLSTDASGNLKMYSMSGFPAPYLDKLIPDSNLPSTNFNILLKGSFFTPNMTIAFQGQTVVSKTFISSTEYRISLTTGATEGSFDVTLNNGVNIVYSKYFLVILGETYIPLASEFINITGGLVAEDGGLASGVTGTQGTADLNVVFDMAKKWRMYSQLRQSNLIAMTNNNVEYIVIKNTANSTQMGVKYIHDGQATYLVITNNAGGQVGGAMGYRTANSSLFYNTFIEWDLINMSLYIENVKIYTFPLDYFTTATSFKFQLKNNDLKSIKRVLLPMS